MLHKEFCRNVEWMSSCQRTVMMICWMLIVQPIRSWEWLRVGAQEPSSNLLHCQWHPGTSIKREVKNKVVYISLDTVETVTILCLTRVHERSCPSAIECQHASSNLQCASVLWCYCVTGVHVCDYSHDRRDRMLGRSPLVELVGILMVSWSTEYSIHRTVTYWDFPRTSIITNISLPLL